MALNGALAGLVSITAEPLTPSLHMATLIGAGFPLVSALDALVPQTKSRGFQKILAQIKNLIVEGNSFARALSNYPGQFSPLYVNMVRAGETSGTLEIVLERLADITEKQQALKNRIQTALAYPIFMLVIGTAVLFILLIYIVPSITSIFADMNQVLPAPTRFLIAVSGFFKSYWWVVLIASVYYFISGGLLGVGVAHIIAYTASILVCFIICRSEKCTTTIRNKG